MNIIANMLRENTGSHFLDSGSAYGRNHERNKGRSFKSEPRATVDFKYGIDVTVSLYHYLVDRCTLATSMDRKFTRFCNKAEHKSESYFSLVQMWLTSLTDQGLEVGGLYGEGEPMTINTYNGESLLSQVIQFTLFRVDHTDYVLLQVHGGCDVRGGYTRPRVFEVEGDTMFDQARGSIYCTGDRDACGAYWDTDDANHWYREGACGAGAGMQLEKFDRTEEKKGETRETGKLHVLEDGSGLCPYCGSKLAADLL